MTNPTIKEAIEEMRRQETVVTCLRCGKTMRIERDGDGIHTCTPKANQTSEEVVSFDVSVEAVRSANEQGERVG